MSGGQENLAAAEATHVFITPSISKELNVQHLPHLKVLTVAGEAPHAAIRDIWAKRVLVYNAYGPTECTIFCTVVLITPDSELTLLGDPLGATQLTILDRDSTALAKVGEIGELCISGPQVARGYLKREEATAAAFISLKPGETIYRIRDLARSRDDGKIDLLGRKDDQVKVNGYRVELGEIENAVLHTGIVKSCVVIAPILDGKRQLVACCVLFSTQELHTEPPDYLIMPPSQSHPFRDILPKLTTLPAFMTPSIWVPITFEPRLTSGKTDKRKLSVALESMNSNLIQSYRDCVNATVARP